MHLELREVGSLPRLAWCARLRRGCDEVEVVHGPWVEARGDHIVEGAWDAPFAEGRFAEAVTLVGTGGCARADGMLFAAASGPQDRLHLLRRGDELFVSNSFPFALVRAGDAPSDRFPYYEHVFFAHAYRGVHRERRSFPTRDGTLVVHECGNVLVTPQLDVVRSDKPLPPEPKDYASYVDLLEGTMGRVFANAADPARKVRYRPLAALSRGYDSPAIAVLARRHGCSEAMTFAENEPGVPDPEDDGRPLGEVLGFSVKAYARKRRPADRPWHDAEFCVCPHGSGRPYLAGESDLEGRVLLSGHWGGRFTSTEGRLPLDLRRDPRGGMAGSMSEFRLRVGFLHFEVWLVGWQHMQSIHRITTSDELRPWSVGGEYDKPVARRMLEEAGVPRDLFGQKKRAGAHDAILRPEDLAESARPDYRAFVADLSLPWWLVAGRRAARALVPGERGRARRAPRLRERLVRRWVPRRHRLPPENGYLFHWGFHRMRDRYVVP